MVVDTDIAWLAGIVDGEGSVQLMNCKDGQHLKPRLSVVNCDISIINRCRLIAMDVLNDRTFSVYVNKRYGEFNKRTTFHISIDDGQLILKMLIQLLPYLTGKKRQAELIVEFLSDRIKGSRYTNNDRVIQMKVSMLNKRGATNEEKKIKELDASQNKG